MRLFLFFAAVVMILCAGCATPVCRQVVDEKTSFNQKEFGVSQDILYQSVVRAMLSRSFIIENEQPAKGFILGKRSFQQGRKTTALLLQAKMIPEGDSKTRLYLSAVETSERLYVVDRTRFFLFIIPLPGHGGQTATQVKEGEKVVQDKVFYRKFFDFICGQVEEVKACKFSQQEITAVTSPVVQAPVPVAVAQPAPAAVVEPSQPAVVAAPVTEQKEAIPAQPAASPEPAAAPVPATAASSAPSDEKAP
jgi:hypothetical protein